jgi:hypothetical protein
VNNLRAALAQLEQLATSGSFLANHSGPHKIVHSVELLWNFLKIKVEQEKSDLFTPLRRRRKLPAK